MNIVYELLHKHIVEYEGEEEICDTKLLGFFSSEDNYLNAIKYYIMQPGFEKYKDGFVANTIEADIDEYNTQIGEFQEKVYYLSHEWYDGEYDYITHLGYYSSRNNAEKAMLLFQNEQEFIENLEGFTIDEYVIDEMEWREGFFSWSEMDGIDKV